MDGLPERLVSDSNEVFIIILLKDLNWFVLNKKKAINGWWRQCRVHTIITGKRGGVQLLFLIDRV